MLRLKLNHVSKRGHRLAQKVREGSGGNTAGDSATASQTVTQEVIYRGSVFYLLLIIVCFNIDFSFHHRRFGKSLVCPKIWSVRDPEAKTILMWIPIAVGRRLFSE